MTRMRHVLSTALLLLVSGAGTRSGSAEEPSKATAGDPATNRALQRYTQPLPDRDQETVRTIVLFRLLSAACVGVKADKPAFDAFLRKSGFALLSKDDREVALRLGAAQFDYLDDEAVAQLCAGSDHLFGPHGVLIAGALSTGTGRSKIRHDPANPYLPIDRFLPH